MFSLLSSVAPGCIRRQLHGEDHHGSANDHYVLDLGFGRATGVRQHAAVGVQRRRRPPFHVRSLTQVDVELGQGVVPTSAWFQQGTPASPYLFASLMKENRPRYHF